MRVFRHGSVNETQRRGRMRHPAERRGGCQGGNGGGVASVVDEGEVELVRLGEGEVGKVGEGVRGRGRRGESV